MLSEKFGKIYEACLKAPLKKILTHSLNLNQWESLRFGENSICRYSITGKIQCGYIDWNSVNFHRISDSLIQFFSEFQAQYLVCIFGRKWSSALESAKWNLVVWRWMRCGGGRLAFPPPPPPTPRRWRCCRPRGAARRGAASNQGTGDAPLPANATLRRCVRRCEACFALLVYWRAAGEQLASSQRCVIRGLGRFSAKELLYSRVELSGAESSWSEPSVCIYHITEESWEDLNNTNADVILVRRKRRLAVSWNTDPEYSAFTRYLRTVLGAMYNSWGTELLLDVVGKLEFSELF